MPAGANGWRWTRRARVVQIERLRTLDGRACVIETLALPAALFPGIGALKLPNTLYSLYAGRFGITIASAQERLKAVVLSEREAALPALEIDRIALDLEDRPVEWRLSTRLTDTLHDRAVLL